MNNQQRRFFQTATSANCSGSGCVTVPKEHFRACVRVAAIFALLFFTSCASLTPERISVLAAIAGQAAQLGAQEWLAKHPEHRNAFNLVIDSISAFIRAGETNMAKYTELLESLPTSTLRGEAGEIYITGNPRDANQVATVLQTNFIGAGLAVVVLTNAPAASKAHLVIWDKELNKAVRVTGALEQPVQRAVRDGLRRAVGPTPPMPPRVGRRGEPVLGIVPEGPPSLPQFQPAKPYPEGTFPPGMLPPGWHTNYRNEPPAKTDAELDAEFLEIKAKLKARGR